MHATAVYKSVRLLAFVLVLALLLTSCGRNMYQQPKKEIYDPSTLFADGASARPLVAGTIPREFDRSDTHLFEGTVNGNLAESFPYPVTRTVLERGQERYNTFCAVCHGLLGDGNGIVIQRGFPEPQTYHSDRLRQVPDGYFFNVITNGFGRMYPYGDRIMPEDRWAITAYIRALQLSQSANLEDFPPSEQERLERMSP
jgi:cytochrome c553